MPESCLNGEDDDCDGKPDCADEDCTTAVMCVPAGPSGFALGVRVDADQPCPPGYLAKETTVSRGLMSDSICTGCGCTVSATSCKPIAYYYRSAGDCDGIPGRVEFQATTQGACQIETPSVAIVGVSYPGVAQAMASCAPLGGAGMLSPPQWQESAKFCELSPGSMGSGCVTTERCVTRTTARACILAGGIQACSGAYAFSHSWYLGYIDGRSCPSCSCQVKGGKCTSGLLSLYESAVGCQNGPPVLVLSAGESRCETPGALVANAPTTVTEAATCAVPASVASGTAAPANPQSFCCLP